MTRRPRSCGLALALLLSLAAGACSSAASGTVAAPATRAVLAAPHPISVAPTLDTARAVSAKIPMKGGTLSATGSDGTVFTLTIPDHALLGAEMVTLTPVAAVKGLPLSGGLLGAAQLEPDGLQLFAPATLVIKPARSTEISSQVGFGYHAGGAELHLYPTAPQGDLTFKIFHFSTTGGGIGTSADIQSQAKNTPTAPEDQAAQDLVARLHDLLSAERRNQILGQPPDPGKIAGATSTYIEDYFNKVVKPKMERALSDDTLIDDAINTALGWERTLALSASTMGSSRRCTTTSSGCSRSCSTTH